jgi:hypothetical protein
LEKEFHVITFESTHYAIMIEKKLKGKYNVQTIPTPREITASCGLSIMFQNQELDEIIQELINLEVDKNMFDIYKIVKTDKGKKAEQINWR